LGGFAEGELRVEGGPRVAGTFDSVDTTAYVFLRVVISNIALFYGKAMEYN